MLINFPTLSLLLWLPSLSAVVVILVARHSPKVAQYIALVSSVLVCLLSILLWFYFDESTASMQFVEKHTWIAHFNIHYHLGIDGLSLPLILLSTFITVITILSAWHSMKKNSPYYMALFLWLECFILGVFMSLDTILFYIFWEALLIPMFLIIGIWGGERRIYASIKFFLFTFFGSIFMLIAFIYMFVVSDSFALQEMYALPLSFVEQSWIFWAFFLAFAVKIPMIPLHTWLPDAHVEAPTAGSVILAAVLLKMGGYGFLRFSLPIVPDAVMYFDWIIVLLSLVAIVYIAFIALAQKDMKKLIAYSSISHMGFVTLGIFIVTSEASSLLTTSTSILALEGGIIHMISHGFISAALFLSIGVLYDRMQSRAISDYGGVATMMPQFAFFAVLFAMANIGVPGTSGFVGEFMIILATMQVNFMIALVAGFTIIISAAYTLWMVKKIFYGEPRGLKVLALGDLHWREKMILTALALGILWLGFYPDPIVQMMHSSVTHLVELATSTKIPN